MHIVAASSESLHRVTGTTEASGRADAATRLPELLLRELQHRTANALNFASLQLEVQARRSEEGPSRAAIETIAASFRQLIEAQRGFAVVDFDAVADAATEVRDACIALAAGFATARPGIRFDCLVDHEVRADVRPAGVLALIVSELVTNAFKHAFRGRDSGYLLVTLAPALHGAACLTVVDDGPGFADPARATGTGTGMGIVRALASAIDAEVSASGGHGTECKVRVTLRPSRIRAASVVAGRADD